MLVTLAGCSAEEATGDAQAVVTLPQGLSANEVARVELIVSGAGMTTRTDALVKTGAQWGGVLGKIPEGAGRTFSAQAFDASNTVRYAGQVTEVTITAGQTTAVTLLLQEVNPPAPFDNVAPLITSLVVSPGTVDPGGIVTLQATAEDPNAGDTLTYAWTAGAGSFNAVSSLTTTWTAPATPGSLVLTLTVTDSKGATAALSATVTVSTGAGSAAVNVSFNTWPHVAGVTAVPSSVAVGQATAVTAVASDADGDSLSYQWTAGCQGTWKNATSPSANFTPTAQPSGGRCALTVTVSDGRGGQGTGTLGIHVGPGTTVRFPPEVVETFQSIATVPSAGGTVVFRVRTKDPQGSALTFAWTANTGTLGTATSGATTSEVLWTASACVPANSTPAVTATVTNALGLSTSASLVLTGGTTCSTSDNAVIRIDSGTHHSMAVRKDGTIWTWGRNTNGQLGDGTTTSRSTPVQPLGLTGIATVVAGYDYTLALKPNGTAWSWGRNDQGTLGDGTRTERHSPVQVQGLTGIVALSAAVQHTIAVKQDGTLWAWGFYDPGRSASAIKTTPVKVPMQGISKVTTGGFHVLVVKYDDTVWGWGDNTMGQLGDGTKAYCYLPQQAQAQGLTGVATMFGGSFHSLALKHDGTVWAWGDNSKGQLGLGYAAYEYILTPMQVQGITGVTAIAADRYHTIALKQDGTVWGWGYNRSGQLGDGTNLDRLTPVQIQGLTNVAAIATGGSHALALKQDGTVWAWGSNNSGQLGDGTTTNRLTPVQVQGLEN
ncbi:PKD domain-containing protein [Corallococcus sp. bb12-1]|nr:PKD domain-containing protein [Corallococcus sp. bb12-1]MCY1042679.1 PKD domain-containing protein [Corallococcus sp. bb12-1]